MRGLSTNDANINNGAAVIRYVSLVGSDSEVAYVDGTLCKYNALFDPTRLCLIVDVFAYRCL